MSTVITIERETPIRDAELHELARGDSTLTPQLGEDGVLHSLRWRNAPSDEGLPLTFDQGKIWSTPRSDAELQKMVEIARTLGAKVVDESGEEVVEGAASRRGGCVGSAITICFAAAASAGAVGTILRIAG